MSDTPRCPAILIAAPSSGQGKTTVTAALARLHHRAGRRVRVFKCGPDFLDPAWLALASGAPVQSLDLWMTGEADCRARLHQAACEADLILLEGVMGLFDGEPSAADLAVHLGLPVLAVIDASAMAGTFGALAWGLASYREGLRTMGVLANRVASAGHAAMLQASLREPHHWLGAMPRETQAVMPERHLGLVSADELPDALARLDAVADTLATTPLGQMTAVDWQAWAVPFPAPAAVADASRPLAGRTIAVARDAAFCFIYPANLECLEALGAQLAFFSPLADGGLPACDALWLPGGYPELHLERLAANANLRAALHNHIHAGRPVWAECGGMMALFDQIVTTNGNAHPAWGLLPGTVTMQPRLAALGPQQLAVTLAAPPLRGHTFHYSTCDTALPVVARSQPAPGRSLRGTGEALYRHGAVRASYFHAWFASSPHAAASLFLPEAV